MRLQNGSQNQNQTADEHYSTTTQRCCHATHSSSLYHFDLQTRRLFSLWRVLDSVLRWEADGPLYLHLFALRRQRYEAPFYLQRYVGRTIFRSSGSTNTRCSMLRVLPNETSALLSCTQPPSYCFFLTVVFGEKVRGMCKIAWF